MELSIFSHSLEGLDLPFEENRFFGLTQVRESSGSLQIGLVTFSSPDMSNFQNSEKIHLCCS